MRHSIKLGPAKVIEAKVKACEKAGWVWEPYVDDEVVLLPPPGDPRRSWCAQWWSIGKNRVVPHWFDPRAVDSRGFYVTDEVKEADGNG